MTDDFGYLNARIRARRSQMLSEGFFWEALRLSFAELVKILGETIYGPDLTGDAPRDVDRAVVVHLQRTVGDLPRLVSGAAREAVHLLLMRSDLANVKMILRGKQAGWTAEEIMGHLAAGTLPRALYGPMAEAAGAAALAQLLAIPRHPLARALRRAVAAAGEPLELEVMLDREFHAALLRRATELDQPYLVSFMRFEIDTLNLATGFKLSLLGVPREPGRFFLPGGRRVDRPLFEALAAGEVKVLEELGGTELAPIAEVNALPDLERGLRCLLLAKAREGVKDALGAGMANDYILHKEWEGSRVRLLVRTSFYELPGDTVEQELFCP